MKLTIKSVVAVAMLLVGFTSVSWSDGNQCGDPGQQPLVMLSGKWVDPGTIKNSYVKTHWFMAVIKTPEGIIVKKWEADTQAKVGEDGVMIVDIPSGFALTEGEYIIGGNWASHIRRKNGTHELVLGNAEWKGCIDSQNGWFFVQLPMNKTP